MTASYTGNPDNITTPLAKTITNATNATPIVITTSAAHGYSTGDYVEILSVGGNTAANGGFRITVTDGTHFSLDGSVGNGAYTAGGSCKNASITPAMTEPVDGEPRTAASVNAMTQLHADALQFLIRRSRKQSYTWTAAGTIVVPADVTQMIFEGVGAGGGGGGGIGNAAGVSGAGGGGAKRARFVCTVVPGETITLAGFSGGTAGTGGNAAGGAATAGGHGTNTTVTGSTSGLLCTFGGAMGGHQGIATTAAVFCGGGLPYKYPATYSGGGFPAGSDYFDNNLAFPGGVSGFVPPISGQGGHVAGNGAGAYMTGEYGIGGGTAYAAGGAVGTVVFSGVPQSAGGGASEWPGGVGGDGVAANVGGNGTLGSGAAGGSNMGAGVAGKNGGVGGAAVIMVLYNGTKAVTT